MIATTEMTTTPHTAAANVATNNCTILPDGSAFAADSFPLPKDHWLYAPREYDVNAENPKELPSPILTHALRAEVVSAIRYAIRGATMCGKETDFDPDALVQNAVYALCGPYSSVALAAPAQVVQQDAERLDFLIEQRAYVVSDPSICDGYWLHYARPNGETWVQSNEHTTPRAAIDAARASQEYK